MGGLSPSEIRVSDKRIARQAEGQRLPLQFHFPPYVNFSFSTKDAKCSQSLMCLFHAAAFLFRCSPSQQPIRSLHVGCHGKEKKQVNST